MNVLAHLTLAGDDPELMAGGFLGDFVKGPVSSEWAPGIAAGIRLHRFIDARSNENAQIRASCARLAAFPRRYAPPFVDLIADYLLARDFRRWHQQSLTSYCKLAQEALQSQATHLTTPAQVFLERIIEIGLLEGYAELPMMTRVAGRVAQRLRMPADTEAKFSAAVEQHEQGLQDDFNDYYPALQRQVALWHSGR